MSIKYTFETFDDEEIILYKDILCRELCLEIYKKNNQVDNNKYKDFICVQIINAICEYRKCKNIRNIHKMNDLINILIKESTGV